MPETTTPKQMSVATRVLQNLKNAIEAAQKVASSIVSEIRERAATPGGYLGAGGLLTQPGVWLAEAKQGAEPLSSRIIGALTGRQYREPTIYAEEAVRHTQQLGEVLGMPYPWTQMSTKLTPTPTAQPPAVTQTTSPGAQTMVTTQAIKKAVETKLPSGVSLGGTPSPISTAVETRIPTGGAPATPTREVSTPTQIAGIPLEAIRRMAAERGVVPSTLFVPEGLPIEARPRVVEEELKRILGRKRGRG
jgi:hypothetical protein